MLDFVTSLGPWNWIVLGAILMALEMAAPGAFMIWLGFAAVAVGALGLVVPLALAWQILIFAVLGLAFAWIGRMVNARVSAGDDAPYLNRRADALVGRVFLLEEPIVAGFGRVRVGDTIWRVGGPDIASGVRVRVRAVDGSTLLVEPA